MSAVKSGATPLAGAINISGTGNTLASIASDIADTAWAELVGSVLTIKCRYIYILPDAELTMGNVNDFSVSEELRHLFVGTVRYNRFYVYHGGKFIVYGNCTIDLGYGCTTAQYPDSAYMYGYWKMEGNGTYNPKLIGARSIYYGINYDYNFFSLERKANCGIDLYNCTVGGCFDNILNYLNQYPYEASQFRIENVLFTLGIYTTRTVYPMLSSGYGRKIFLPAPIKNISPEISTAYFRFASNWSGLWFKDVDWTGVYNGYFIQQLGQITQASKLFTSNNEAYNDTILNSYKYGQPFDYCLDNCKFTSAYATYWCYNYFGATPLFKDCPTPTSNKKALTYVGATAYCWNSDGIYSYTYLDAYGSSVRKVYRLKLTVTDLSGNPLEGVQIKISQKDGYEEYKFETGTDGLILAPYNIQGALLTNKAKYVIGANNSDGTEVAWSDSSNSTYHTVTILKEGYKAETFNVVMDEDKEMTVQLRPLTKMYLGSTELTGITL